MRHRNDATSRDFSRPRPSVIEKKTAQSVKRGDKRVWGDCTVDDDEGYCDV